MRGWYRERDLIPELNEARVGPEVSLDSAVDMMMAAVNLLENDNGADR